MVAHDLLRASLIFAALVPSSLAVAAILVSRRAPFGAAAVVTNVTVGLSIVAVMLRALAGAMKGGSMVHGLVQLDLVSCAMLVLVCTLSIVVVRYSRTYLVGEAGLVRYARSLLLTLASVTVLVITNQLAVIVAAWLATGIGLHQLLTFYRTRRQAVIVAHKEFLLSRIADMCFFASLVLVHTAVGSLQIDVVNAFAEAKETLPPSLHLATVLLVCGVLLKSAQLPFHGWILQVMEAPTPVSALLHAGVVNIGGFVMIRLGPLMARASIAQGLLLGVGLVTAIVGSLVMTTRVSIKIVLAWSTIAQMGFMLVQCGLGAWQLALLHLLAHSLYKAHAFLTSGGVVDDWRGASIVRRPRTSLLHIGAALVILGMGGAPFYALFTRSAHIAPSFVPLAVALGLSFVPMIARALAGGRRALGLAALFTLGATASYFAWHILFEEVVPSSDGGSSFAWTIVLVGLVALFITQTLLQTSPSGRVARFLQPHLFKGLYMDEWFTRMTFRLWPPRLERPTAVSRRSIAGAT
jgi:NAD(P)H-quinone oxidoreductase subunit 5